MKSKETAGLLFKISVVIVITSPVLTLVSTLDLPRDEKDFSFEVFVVCTGNAFAKPLHLVNYQHRKVWNWRRLSDCLYLSKFSNGASFEGQR